jgi:hypothetical protein
MSYQEDVGYIGSRTANAALSTGQYQLVAFSTDSQIAIQTTRGGVVVGSLYDASTAAGIDTSVAYRGIVKVRCGGTTESAITPGTRIIASTDGVGIAWSTVGSYIFGRAVENLSSAIQGVIGVLATHEGASS